MRDFPFVEMPDREALEEAIDSLKRQGVILAHDEKTLSPLGMILANLPVDVLVGKVSKYTGCKEFARHFYFLFVLYMKLRV